MKILEENSLRNRTTTIRVKEGTKNKISNLDFVKKDTYDEILAKLIKFYEERKSK